MSAGRRAYAYNHQVNWNRSPRATLVPLFTLCECCGSWTPATEPAHTTRILVVERYTGRPARTGTPAQAVLICSAQAGQVL